MNVPGTTFEVYEVLSSSKESGSIINDSYPKNACWCGYPKVLPISTYASVIDSSSKAEIWSNLNPWALAKKKLSIELELVKSLTKNSLKLLLVWS